MNLLLNTNTRVILWISAKTFKDNKKYFYEFNQIFDGALQRIDQFLQNSSDSESRWKKNFLFEGKRFGAPLRLIYVNVSQSDIRHEINNLNPIIQGFLTGLNNGYEPPYEISVLDETHDFKESFIKIDNSDFSITNMEFLEI